MSPSLAMVASWVSPTSLFLILNIVIATIYITSKKPQHQNGSEPNSARLTRPPSLIDRVKSFNLSRYQSALPNNDTHYVTQPGEYGYEHEHEHGLARFASAPSLLDRVRSFKFNQGERDDSRQPSSDSVEQVQLDGGSPSLLQRVRSFKFNQRDDYRHSSSDSVEQGELDGGAPSLFQRVRSFKFNQETEANSPESANSVDSPKLVRTPFLERVKSIKLPTLYRPGQPDTEPTSEKPVTGTGRVSEQNQKRNKSAARMTKSASEKIDISHGVDEEETVDVIERRRPETVRVERTPSFGEGNDEAVDAKADDFINRFKQQLKLQRLDSILRRGKSIS